MCGVPIGKVTCTWGATACTSVVGRSLQALILKCEDLIGQLQPSWSSGEFRRPSMWEVRVLECLRSFSREFRDTAAASQYRRVRTFQVWNRKPYSRRYSHAHLPLYRWRNDRASPWSLEMPLKALPWLAQGSWLIRARSYFKRVRSASPPCLTVIAYLYV